MAENRGTSRRSRTLGLIALAIAVLYVGSYFALSRYCRRLNAEVGGEGFYYIPVRSWYIDDNENLNRLHILLTCFYYSIWAVDYHLLGGPPIASFPLRSVSG